MADHPWFFDSWHSLERIAVVGALAYLTLVVVLRITGHKSLTKMNIFDFVFVVALGDVLASGLMDKESTYMETVTGLLVLLALRIILQVIAKRSDSFERFLNGAAILMFRRGEFY